MKLEAALPIRVAICAILASNTPGRCRGLWVCLSPRIARLEKVPWREWQLQDQSVHVLFLTLFSFPFSLFKIFPKHCACWEEWGVFCRSFFKSWIPNAISLKAFRKHSEIVLKHSESMQIYWSIYSSWFSISHFARERRSCIHCILCALHRRNFPWLASRRRIAWRAGTSARPILSNLASPSAPPNWRRDHIKPW